MCIWFASLIPKMELNWNPVVARLAIPVVVTALLLNSISIKEFSLCSRVFVKSDEVISLANREGEINENFDYIIIGAGSAGAVLTKRLTESGKFSVLLLDRGGDPYPVSDIPYAVRLTQTSNMTASYKSIRQDKACLENKGICRFLLGISLGGTSSINGMVYNRCNVKDYDQWANFTGDSIWNGKSVTVAFKDIENYTGWYNDKLGKSHGTKGEIYIETIPSIPGTDTFYKAIAEQGYPIGDINSLKDQFGFGKMDFNMKNQIRWGTYHAFLEPIMGRPNLKIHRYAWVKKIHFDKTVRAIGVSYTRHGKKCYAGANKEVVLSAGTINSPKLLMLSGIGSKSQLKKFKIPKVCILPSVGENLQDHVMTYLPHFVLNKTFGKADYETPENILEYVTNASGPFQWISTSNNFSPRLGMGYISSKANQDKSWPDLHIDIDQQHVIKNDETIRVKVVLAKTEQTGTVKLSNRKYEYDPVIDPRILENPEDVERIVDGIEEMVDFFLNSPTYKALGIKWSEKEENPPNCDHIKFATRKYWLCYVRQRSALYAHCTSTCRMGPNRDVAVVDSRLRVFGTTGLRVIDASVIPFVPNGNTNMPSIMVGEMGAKIILNLI